MSGEEDIFAGFRTPEPGKHEAKARNTGGGDTEPEAGDEYDPDPYILPPLRPEKYTAIRLGKRRERLLIDRASHPMRFPAYHELRDISFDQAFQQGFNLFYQGMTVEITGKNLWPVAHAISCGRCEAVYEYHAKLYPARPAKGEPIIESINLSPPVALADDEDD